MAARTKPFRRIAKAHSARARMNRARAPVKLSVRNPRLNAVTAKSRRATLIYKSFNTYGADAGNGDQVLSANGLFDVDITGSGHQPAGFDQYMDFYDHYEVISSKIVCKIIAPEAASTGNQLIAVVALRDDTGVISITTIDDQIENGMTAWGVIGSGGSTGSNGVITLNNSFVKREYFGDRKGDTFVGNSAANPTEGAFYVIKIASAVEGNTTNTVIMHYEVIYDVIFTERKRVLSS